MASNSEEEYLDQLLKQVMQENNSSAPEESGTEFSASESEKETEFDLTALTEETAALAEETEISADEHIIEPVTDSFSGDINTEISTEDLMPEEPTIEEPAIEEPAFEEPAFEEPALEEPALEEPSLESLLSDNPILEEPEEPKPVGVQFDIMSSMEGMDDSTGLSADEGGGELFNDLKDILALDEGESIEDIPADSDEQLSDDELQRVADMETPEESGMEEPAGEFDDIIDLEKEEKKDKKKKKKSSKSKSKNKSDNETDEFDFKEKKKGGFFKRFFTILEDDEEEEDAGKTKDENQELIDSLYSDKDSLDELNPEDNPEGKGKKGKKEKKEKKVKEPKPKKEKAPKQKKEKDDKAPKGKIDIKAVLRLIIISGIIIAAVVIASSKLNYVLARNRSREAYGIGDYTTAFAELDGYQIWNSDLEYMGKLRLIMRIQNGLNAYNNYMSMKDIKPGSEEAKGKFTDAKLYAIDSLIKTVETKYSMEDQSVKYNAVTEVNAVYKKVTDLLKKYGIDEREALELKRMTNFDEYLKKLREIVGE